MGDSGSLFIGFVLGFISILFDWNPVNQNIYIVLLHPVFLFFTIPFLDFITVFVYRIKNKISPTTGGTDHISHRLLNESWISVKRVLRNFCYYKYNYIFLLIFINNFESVFYLYFLFIYFYNYFYLFKFSKMNVLN